MALPKILSLKSVSNDKYLRHCFEETKDNGLLQFSGQKARNSAAQFHVVKANTGGDLVHLKCPFNNEFLVRRAANEFWITASSKAANEDQKSWQCTLFKPMFINKDDPHQIRLVHVQTGLYVCLYSTGGFDSCLYASSKDPLKDSTDIFTVIDWDSESGDQGSSEESHSSSKTRGLGDYKQKQSYTF